MLNLCLNILEYKKYFLKVKEFILLIYKYEKYIDINDLVTDKIRCIINLFKDRFNNKVHYFNFIYIELFNSICNDINFNNVKKYKGYLSDLEYKYSNKYLYDTFSTMMKVIYYKKNNELDNINIYRLLYVACVTGYYRSFNSKYSFIFIDDIEDYSSKKLEQIAQMGKSQKIVAIGEIGLDYHYDGYDKNKQIKYLNSFTLITSFVLFYHYKNNYNKGVLKTK